MEVFLGERNYYDEKGGTGSEKHTGVCVNGRHMYVSTVVHTYIDSTEGSATSVPVRKEGLVELRESTDRNGDSVRGNNQSSIPIVTALLHWRRKDR